MVISASTKRRAIALAVFLVALCIVGCSKTPVETRSTNNVDVKVDLLFEYDGCKVYRFSDAGSNHYFARCPDGSVSTSYDISEGKHTRPEEIATTK